MVTIVMTATDTEELVKNFNNQQQLRIDVQKARKLHDILQELTENRVNK